MSAKTPVYSIHESCVADPILVREHSARIANIEKQKDNIAETLSEVNTQVALIAEQLKDIKANQTKIGEDVSAIRDDISNLKSVSDTYGLKIQMMEEEKKKTEEENKEVKKSWRNAKISLIVAVCSVLITLAINKIIGK
jgi:chromosome segregation ATPase